MVELSVSHYHHADWVSAEPYVQAALHTNAASLRIINVHVGQVGTIEFDLTPFTASSGGTPSILDAALALVPAQLAPGVIVELHGHFNTVQVSRYPPKYRRELHTIAFKLTQPGAQAPRYLGRMIRSALPTNVMQSLDREINLRRWQQR